MKKLLKWLAYTAAVFIVLVSIIAGVTQTQFFREKLRTFALSQLDSLLDAETYLGEIRGNLISGFSIDSVSITVQNEQFVSVERLDIRYDLFQIPSKKIDVSSLTLVRPRIALLRGRDSIWNFVRMVRPTPDDSTKQPFDWPVAVDRFDIKDGAVRLVDSASLAEPDHGISDSYSVEYHNVAVRNLNMVVTSARITPYEKRAKIASLNFIADDPDVQLKQFSGEFRVTKQEALVKNMVVQTARSKLRLDVSMKNFDLFSGIELPELKSKPVELSLRTNDLDFGELKRFIHQLDFLHGKLTSEIVAEGEFGRMRIRQLDLKTRGSELHFAGLVSNLHTPEKLSLNMKCRESVINYKDVLALLPTLNLPDYTSLGPAGIEFDFDGEPLDFKTNLSMQTDAGSLSTNGATLKIGGAETLRYDGEFFMRNLNLASLLNDAEFEGTLNGSVKINGSGTSLDNIRATVEARIDSSLFAGERVGQSQISISASDSRIDGVLNLALGSMRSRLHAELDRTDNAIPSFAIDGAVSSLDLADILHDESQGSDLTLGLKVEGRGLQLDRLSGRATLDFASSRYKEYQIDSSHVNIAIDQRDPLRSSITVNSELADFAINGQFDLDYMVGLIRYEVDNLSLAVGQRFKSLDSSLATLFDVKALAASGKRLASQKKVLDAEYELTIKNLEPLSILAGDRTFDAIGTVHGTLRGNYEDLAGEAKLQLVEFFYGNADSGMLVQDGIATLKFSDLKPVNPLSELTLRVRADAGKMHINRTKLDTLKVGIFYDKEYAGFVVQADYDQDLHLKTNGQVGVTDDGVQFTMSNFNIAYKDFGWKADDGGIIAINQNGMRVQTFSLRRDSQVVAISGSVRTGGALDANLSCRKLNLGSLVYLVQGERGSADARAFEGVANLDAHASGTLAAPLYDVKFRAQNVFFRGFPFGEIQGDLNYKDEMLVASLLIDHRKDRTVGLPDLSVKGTLPINLSLKGVEGRLGNMPMDFTVYSDGLQMSLLDPLLPTFNELSGTLKANFKVGGTPKKPNFNGSMSIEGSSFLFVPNNLYYKLDGTFQPEGERIKVLTTAVRNIDADNKPGRVGVINVTGDLALSELIPSDFNLDVKGQLLVVNKNTRTSSLAVYGELPVEIAQRGLRFTGNLDRTLLRGDVLVRNSNLAFPPTTSSSKEDTFYIPLKIVDDTTKVMQPMEQAALSRYFTSGLHRRDSSGAESKEGTKKLPSFIDGLRYDLNVEFAGSNNEVRMIFNPATSEELVASITGKVTITEDGSTWGGVLDVSRASYNFYGKRFDADGTIAYSGDFLNPEMNIVATYKGARQYDVNAKEEKVIVTYKIVGTRLAPKPEISMTIDDVDYYSYKNSPTSNDVQSDALTFVITNNFPLTRGERNNIAEQVGPTVGAGLVGGATSLLTSSLAEFLRTQTGFINSFEFRYDTNDKSADLRLGGTAFKGYWRYGGKILEDPFSNANFSILYSFGDIFDRPALRNFMFELERKVETTSLGSFEPRKENSARFFYRFSF